LRSVLEQAASLAGLCPGKVDQQGQAERRATSDTAAIHGAGGLHERAEPK